MDTDDTTDVKTLLKTAMEERLTQAEKLSDSIKRFNETLDSVTKKHESVDICDPEDLVFFKQGDTLDDDVERNLQVIREFVDNHKDSTTELYTKTHSNEGSQDKAFTRTAIIIELNRRLLPLTTWSYIEQNVEDDKFFFTLLTLLSLKSDTLPMGHYVKGLLTNPVLFQHVLLK